MRQLKGSWLAEAEWQLQVKSKWRASSPAPGRHQVQTTGGLTEMSQSQATRNQQPAAAHQDKQTAQISTVGGERAAVDQGGARAAVKVQMAPRKEKQEE